MARFTQNKADFIFGIRPVLEAIEADINIDKILVKRGLQGELFNELNKEIQKHRLAVQKVPEAKLSRITRKNHQGVIAFISPIPFHNVEHLVQDIYEKGENPLLLILDGITDVRNFGAIARTAECMGCHGIIIPRTGSAQINQDAVKVSTGALLNIPVCKVDDLSETVQFLQSSGVFVVSCTEQSNKELFESKLGDPLCVILGAEDKGISRDLINLSDDKAGIRMLGKTESLNVSVSAGMALYEVQRQRQSSEA